MSKEKKQFRELSEEELEKVNGGFAILLGAEIPEECKDEQYRCNHQQVCNYVCSSIG